MPYIEPRHDTKHTSVLPRRLVSIFVVRCRGVLEPLVPSLKLCDYDNKPVYEGEQAVLVLPGQKSEGNISRSEAFITAVRSPESNLALCIFLIQIQNTYV